VERSKSDSYDPFDWSEDTAKDRERLVLFRSNFSFAIMNQYFYNPENLLVLPKKAFSDIDELSELERVDFFMAISKPEFVLKKALAPDEFSVAINIGSAAGAGISKHLHCDIVPHLDGDTN
jgi:ATP adenylyltransferase